jgi:short-subunit dehydrogenase
MFNKFVITGTSSGLGEGIAVDLLNADENVIGISSSVAKSKYLIDNQCYDHVVLDLNDLNAIVSLDISKLIFPSDKICLIINAAQFSFDDSLSIEINSAITLFNVNYHSAVSLIKLFNKNLKRVIFINSISGLNSQIHQSQYSASKHALQAYSEVLAKESVGLGFDVMSLNPGGMKTPLWNKIENSVDVAQFLEIETVVRTVRFLSSLPVNTYIKNFTLLPGPDVMNN